MNRVRLCSADWIRIEHLDAADDIWWSVGANSVLRDILIIAITSDERNSVPRLVRPWLGSIHSLWRVNSRPTRMRGTKWRVQAKLENCVRLGKPVPKADLEAQGLLPGGRLPQHPTSGKLYGGPARVRLAKCLAQRNPRQEKAIKEALLREGLR